MTELSIGCLCCLLHSRVRTHTRVHTRTHTHACTPHMHTHTYTNTHTHRHLMCIVTSALLRSLCWVFVNQSTYVLQYVIDCLEWGRGGGYFAYKWQTLFKHMIWGESHLSLPQREAGDVWCLPPVWNLRAVIGFLIWFHFANFSCVLLPSPVTHSVLFCLLVLSSKLFPENSSVFFVKREAFLYDSCLAARRSQVVGGMCSMLP